MDNLDALFSDIVNKLRGISKFLSEQGESNGIVYDTPYGLMIWKSKESSPQPDTIYTDEAKSIKDALEQMTDEWIEDGQYCDQTLMDLRDALKWVIT
jgi:hypothetical protein